MGGRKGIWPVKTFFEWWGTGMVICLERDADLHVAQLMPLPLTVSSIRLLRYAGNSFLQYGSLLYLNYTQLKLQKLK